MLKHQMRQKALIASVLRDLDMIAVVDPIRTTDAILTEVDNADNTPIAAYEALKVQWVRLGINVPAFPIWLKMGAEVHTRLIIQNRI